MNSKAKPGVDYLSLLFIAVIIVAGILTANCYIQQYEKNYSLKNAKSELTSVQQEGEALRIKYESCTNLKSVESYASEKLQMVKINPYQIQYIVSTNTNKLESIDAEENRALFSRLTSAFSVIAEYFK